jgi:hypothetical protein
MRWEAGKTESKENKESKERGKIAPMADRKAWGFLDGEKSEKKFMGLEKNKFSLMLLLIFIGIALRAYFFNSTDITWDEAFHIMLGYKIGAILSLYPIIALGLIAGLAAVIYFSAIKPNTKALVLFAVLALAAVYLFSASPVLHPRHPPLFSIAIAPLTMLGFGPLDAAYIINTFSALLMAFTAFFLARNFFNENAAIFAFAFVMLSPYNIFYSASAYITPLADSLMFAGLALFFIAFEKNKNWLPFSALLLAAAFFTRYTTLMALPVIGIYLFLKRDEIKWKENTWNYIPFLFIAGIAILALLPSVLNSFSGFASWTQATTADLYIRDMPHYSPYLINFFGENPIKPQPLFLFKEMLAFYSIAFVALFIISAVYALKKRNATLISLLAMFGAYFIFYSIQKNFQDMNYLLELEFIMIFATAVFLSEIRMNVGHAKVGSIFAVGVAALFLTSSVFLVTTHNFTGLSETVRKIPEGKTIFTDFIDPVKYYRGEYVNDRTLNNKAFAIITQIFGQQSKPSQSTIAFSNDSIDSLQERPDYAILTQLYFDEGKTTKGFEKCSEIKEGDIVAFYVFAENSELCDAIQ